MAGRAVIDAFPPGGVLAGALLLDLDGTLVDTTEAVEASWRWGAEVLGVPFDAVEPYMHGIPGWQALDLAVPGRLTRSEQDALAARLLARMADADAHVSWMPGAEDLVGVLTGRPGTPWAIVTSGNDVLARSSMRKVPVPVPPVVVTADDVRLGKPEPEPYLSAASALGVEPSACLVVEDAPAGVAAGRAAGMRVLGLATTYPREALARADWVVGSLADVRAEALGEPTGDARIRLTLR